jgi:hypothetical protein
MLFEGEILATVRSNAMGYDMVCRCIPTVWCRIRARVAREKPERSPPSHRTPDKQHLDSGPTLLTVQYPTVSKRVYGAEGYH